MTDMDKILQALAGLQQTVEKQGKQLTALQDTVENQSKAIAELQTGQKTLELKVEAFRAEQKQANDEIIRIFHNIEEINHKEIEKRVERMERRLNLTPLK